MELKDLTDKKTIVELYYKYGEELYENAEADNKALRETIKMEEKLFNSLTKEQQEQLKEIDNLRNEAYGEKDKRLFVFAFDLGVRLILESIR